MMVTLLGTTGRGRLQTMGMLPTLVSRRFSPSTQKALDCNRMLWRLLRRLKRGARTLPLLFHQLRRAWSSSLRACWRGTLATSASQVLSGLPLAWVTQAF